MDWGRAKSVLIVAFLLLNLLLGYQLWLEWRSQVGTSVDWTSLPPETRQTMQEKGIRIDAKIPAETPFMRDLTYKLIELQTGESGERILLEEPREARIVFSAKELNDALGDVIPNLSQYAYDDPGSREGVFVLNLMVDGFPSFDIHLELFNSEQQIQAYRQDVVQLLPSEGAQPQQVLPASKAVALLIENYLPAGTVIKDIRLGYHGQIFPDAETQVSSPSWRVLLENGEVYYVHAINADVTTGAGDDLSAPATDSGK
jgi:regulatory protein YycI of two-component signal transduction system YycFG